LFERQDLRSIEPLPPEQRLAVSAAAEIEIFAPAELEDLRELPRMAEGVGFPADAGVLAVEALAEIALAVEEMPRVRFGRDHVLIALADAPADDLPVAGLHLLLHLLENVGKILFRRRIERRRRLRKLEARKLLHEFDRLPEGVVAD